MSQPHVALDPDPLVDPVWLAQAEAEVWEDGYATGFGDGCRGRRVEIVVAAVAGAIVGAALTLVLVLTNIVPASAAPRGEPEVVVPATLPARPGAPRSGLPVAVLEPAASGVVAAPVASVGASPTGEIGTAIQGGLASWCAPTPRYCRGWGGDAHLAAVPDFRFGDQPYRVIVRHGGRSTVVTVVSFCACGNKIIDLSPAAFVDLAPPGTNRDAWLDRGVLQVTVEDAGPGVTAPPTSTEP